MFVNAPSLSENGDALETDSFDYTASSFFGTFDEAMSRLGDYNHASVVPARRERDFMQNGIISYKKYENTPYFSLAVRYDNFSALDSIYGNGRTTSDPQWYNVRTRYPLPGNYNSHCGIGNPHTAFDFTRVYSASEAVENRRLTTNLRNRVENEAKMKARDQRLDLSESLTDIGPTVRMVAERTSQVLRAWTAIRRGNVKGAIRALGLSRSSFRFRNVAQAWLELQYGWRPLLSDIHAGVNLVNDSLSRSDEQIVVTRRGSEPLKIPDGVASQQYFPGLRQSGYANAYAETKYRFRVDDPTLAYLTQLGLENPAYIAWVALPFSFVIDWLAPVGDWLRGFTSHLGLKFTSGYTSVKTIADFTVTCETPYDPGSVWTLRYSKGTFKYRCRSNIMRRYPHNDWPLTKLYFRFPFSSSTRIANAIALLTATLTRRG